MISLIYSLQNLYQSGKGLGFLELTRSEHGSYVYSEQIALICSNIFDPVQGEENN